MFSTFSDWLVARRAALGIESQAELLQRLADAGLEVSRQTVWKWEHGATLPSDQSRPYLWRVLAVYGHDEQLHLAMAIDGYRDFPPVEVAA